MADVPRCRRSRHLAVTGAAVAAVSCARAAVSAYHPWAAFPYRLVLGMRHQVPK
jgi:hypothetical protein